MNFALVIYGAPFSRQASDTAYQFARAALARGHQIYRVFFYHDAVYNANALSTPPTDEPDLGNRWSQLASDHGIELSVCVAAALRRGVLDEGESARYGKAGANLAPGFSLAGLGQLVDAGLQADRLITFGT